ncbi:MAG TPA: HD domain-containing protein [Pseudomonadales bacterium]|nr:HD domain-containing protein [Pseudomonadales bacterium]
MSEPTPDASLEGALAFIREAERLKSVTRFAWTSTGRRESTAEHTWRLCLMAMVFEPRLADIDLARLLKLCVIHDLGEAIHGDVPATEQDPDDDRSARERLDLQTLMTSLEPDQQAHFLALWDEYEQAASPEARIAKGLDKLETIIQHNQGANPADFDYAFNLDYGRHYTAGHPLLEALRARIDDDTRLRMGPAPQQATGSD